MAKILVIDDEADLLEMMRLTLERRGGHQTVLSAEGKEGLALALADPPDLAIIDVMMPGVTGYEICRRLRANPSTASVPVLILTARAQPVDRDAALDAGADDYMTKPVMMAELLDRIDTLLTKRTIGKSPISPETIVLLSLRGGVGVTTLAVNLAATLAQAGNISPVGGSEGGTATCLVDLCPSSGHAALQLGLRPDPNWSDLFQASDVEGVEIIESHLLQHGSGLRVLASPFLPVVGQGAKQKAMRTTLGILQQQFAYIVVDAPSVLDETTMSALEVASAVEEVTAVEEVSRREADTDGCQVPSQVRA